MTPAQTSEQTLALTINGEPRRAAPGSIADLVRSLELDPAKVAVERNGDIVPRSTLADVALADAAATVDTAG